MLLVSYKERAKETPLDGPYPALGEEVRRILHWYDSDEFAYMTARAAARKTGISYTSIANMTRGDRPKADLLMKFASAMKADARKLMTLAGYLPEDYLPPVDAEDPLSRIGPDISTDRLENFPLSLSSATAGVGSPIHDGREGERLGDVLDTDLRTIRVDGDCMRPYFAPGDILFVRSTETAENGNKVVAILEDDTITCKVFRQHRGEAWLEASNGGYQRIDGGFRIVGVVVKVLKDV